jgi:hypothetical protein
MADFELGWVRVRAGNTYAKGRRMIFGLLIIRRILSIEFWAPTSP